ncbi:hypothetical protein [Microbacterium sp. JB110]|uniref:hypothetical protein n=1 Tax=Microbacterium sp. JB110 TaxID=2024477 RepID=UPI00097E8E78|nr:hypothetical protein [Microbacterium sp. JB110]SJM45036.1 Conjugative transfer protein TrbL [Frigoribacterium sp. JB110]
MSAKAIRLTVADAHSRHDLVVRADSTVAELLAVGGVDLNRYVGTTTSGAAIDLDSEVSAAPGDGGVIWLFDRSALAPTHASGRGAARAGTGLARPRWTALALLLVVALGLVACTVAAPSPITVSVSVSVLLIGAVIMLVQPVRERNVYVAFVAPPLAATAGALALSPFSDAAAMIAAGAVAGATAACARHASARAHGDTAAGTTGAIAALWSVFAVLNAAAFIADVPVAAVAAVQAACAAPIFRYMRGAALDVNSDELIDTPFVIRDAQGIRSRPATEPSPVRSDRAAHQTLLARRRSEAGTVTAGALALLSSLCALLAITDRSIEAWCVLGGTLGIGCYFLLTSRSVRDGLTRGASMVTGAVVTVAAAAALLNALHVGPLLISLALVLVGGIVGCLTVPLAQDWRSLGWSRTGDIIEAILLALSPAALVYGSGIAGQILEVFS